jgi:insecticidal toxin complex protein TccC
MSANPTNLAFGTPTLTVRDNRGASVRTLYYNRQSVGDELDERIERTIHDPLERVASRIDSRFLRAGGAPNFSYQSSLSGRVLRTDSVDTGKRWTLEDVDGRVVWSLDARGTSTTWTYDLLGRPLTLEETECETKATRDVWIYGEQEPQAQANNLRGQCARRYDTAGKLAWSGYRLTGQPLDETRQLLADAQADADWPGDNETAWSGALDTTQYCTVWAHDATGEWCKQTDAKGNVQQRSLDVAGRLASSSLTLEQGAQAQPLLSSIDYSAAGQVLSETAGNGVVRRYEYEAETQRLIRASVVRPTKASRATVAQDLHYTYDPVGNVLSVSDEGQASSYWRNQRIEPKCIYEYDALYQLISASGREMVNRGPQEHTLPTATIPLPTDDSIYANYTRTYSYDRGGNLTQIQHSGLNSYTQAIVVSDSSNHSMQQNALSSLTPKDIDDGSWFDASGNAQMLLPDQTQPLVWDGRNALKQVTLVKRDGANGENDDWEAYQYGADGMRVRKHMRMQTGGGVRTVEAIYLPGLTLRVTASGSDKKSMKVIQSLQEVESGAASVRARCLHWEVGQPQKLGNDSTRYGVGELNGSIGLEFDEQAQLISREEYYPYGGTAVWTARSQIEADTKYVRYSSKERDATGLYDYGFRYYQPWIGRWLNADPAGIVDGLNLYRMVRNNPATWRDADGLIPTGGGIDIEARIEGEPGNMLCLTKAQVGFVQGEIKPLKPPLPAESAARMTHGVLHRFNKALYYQGPPRFLADGEPRAEPVETILVHGTFNPDAPEVGWTRPHLDVIRRLRDRYGGNLSAMQWSGKNHRHARIAAGRALADRIAQNTASGIRTNVIAHSHGGNVVFEAIKALNSPAERIEQLVTLGTPIREDHLPSLQELRRRTGVYLHVSGGRDTIAPKGGADFVKFGRGMFIGDKASYGRARRKNPFADLQLHIADATHSELHARAVLDMLRPFTTVRMRL